MVGYVGIIIFEAAYKITTTYELEINEKSTYNNFYFPYYGILCRS